MIIELEKEEKEKILFPPQTKYCSAAHPQGIATFLWGSLRNETLFGLK